jgi:hypothetical protein
LTSSGDKVPNHVGVECRCFELVEGIDNGERIWSIDIDASETFVDRVDEAAPAKFNQPAATAAVTLGDDWAQSSWR